MSDQPVNPPRAENLSEAFAGNLKGLRRVGGRRSAGTQSAGEPQGAPGGQGVAPAPRRSGRRGAQVRSADPYAKRPITLWLTEAHRAEVRRRATAEDATLGSVVLEAVKSTHGQLAELVAQESAGQIVSGELWDEIVPSAAAEEPRRQVKVVVTQQQLDVIDRLVGECGADSRSHLITIALDNHFGGDA